jgi:hypothetical protein
MTFWEDGSMKLSRLTTYALAILCGSFLLSSIAVAEMPQPKFKVDKKLCNLMVRFGKEAFARSRYADAKYYFQKAVQADPGSQKAWNFYDLASFYAVGEQMKAQGKYIFRPTAPTTPPEALSSAPAASPSGQEKSAEATQGVPIKPKKKEEIKFKIADDEGC